MFVRWGTTVLALTSALLVTASAAAQEPLDPTKVDPTLKGLMFGSSKEQLVSFLKLRAANRYDGLIRDTLDVRDRDRFAREKAEAVGAVGNDWVAFEGAKTGWDSSIIRDEFAHNTGEEMLHLKEGDTNLYFFFTKGSFYKLSRTGAARPVADMMTDLGRPWRPYASVTFINCELGDHIKPDGWSIWVGNQNHLTARYAEYNSTGPGANPGKRLDWTKQLTKEQADKITIDAVLGGTDRWNPKAPTTSAPAITAAQPATRPN